MVYGKKTINTFVDNQTIFNRLDDKRSWISEWAKIKKINTRKLC